MYAFKKEQYFIFILTTKIVNIFYPLPTTFSNFAIDIEENYLIK